MRSSVPALQALHVALDALPPTHSRKGPALGNWRWTVRQRLADVRTVLINETDAFSPAWRSEQDGSLLDARNSLLERIRIYDSLVLQSPEPDVVRRDLMRLMIEIDNHVLRVRDVVDENGTTTTADA